MKFMNDLDFVRMKPDKTFIAIPSAPTTRMFGLSEAGKQYAAYILSGQQINPTLTLPAGKYSISWMDPVSGAYSKKEILQHKGGSIVITSPPIEFDIALRIVKEKK
jgi:hypothetical protein